MIKYIKSVLWRVAKRLSYVEDTRCLKVKSGPSKGETVTSFKIKIKWKQNTKHVQSLDIF